VGVLYTGIHLKGFGGWRIKGKADCGVERPPSLADRFHPRFATRAPRFRCNSTRSGYAKLADFGLAKIVELEVLSDLATQASGAKSERVRRSKLQVNRSIRAATSFRSV
jgi:hypothetical protein